MAGPADGGPAGPRRGCRRRRSSSSAWRRPRATRSRPASQWCADAIAADGLVHLFGTGHSRIPVEEMFPRYGSYPGFNPMVELSMTFHTQVVGSNGQRQAMFIERTSGLAEVILVELRLRAHGRDDGLLGRRHVGRAGRDGARCPARGLRVIAVTSVEQSRPAEADPMAGARLLDEADSSSTS